MGSFHVKLIITNNYLYRIFHLRLGGRVVCVCGGGGGGGPGPVFMKLTELSMKKINTFLAF